MSKKFHVIFALFLALCLAACGQKEQKGQNEPNKNTGAWKEKGFLVTEKINEEGQYWIERFEPMNRENMPVAGNAEGTFTWASPKVRNGKTCQLFTVSPSSSGKALRWILETYDAETKESQYKEFTYETLGLTEEDQEGVTHYLTDVDWIGDSEFVFQWVAVSESDGRYLQTSDKRIYFNDQTGETSQIELWDACMEQGMKEDVRDGSFIPAPCCLCDGRGYAYKLISKENDEDISRDELLVFDREGRIVFQYQIPQKWKAWDNLKTEDGEILYLFQDEAEKMQRILWIDAAGEKTKELASLPAKSTKSWIVRLLGMEGDMLYYETVEEAYSWNVATGERTVFLNYSEDGMPYAYERVLVTGTGAVPQVRLCKTGNWNNDPKKKSNEWIAMVSMEQKDRQDKQTQIAMLVSDDAGSQLLIEATAIAVNENPNNLYGINRIKKKEEKDILLTQLIAGEGPDVLYVSRSDFMTMAEKGLLVDISEVMEQETLDEVLPAALELGTHDGKLLGLPVCVTAESILVSKETWSESSWNIDDLLWLLREHKLSGSMHYAGQGTDFHPWATYMTLISNSLQEPWLIDRENGRCHFDGERILELMTLLGAVQKKDEDIWLGDGEKMAFFEAGSNDFVYQFGVREEQEKGHYVGFPTDGTCGSYMDTKGILVIRKGTKRMDEVRDLFASVFDKDVQIKKNFGRYAGISVMKLDDPEITTGEDGKLYADGKEIQILKNGKTTIAFAEEFLESCIASPLHEDELENIIREEAGTYFMGDKSVKEVAQIIQNRVQLYLNEAK